MKKLLLLFCIFISSQLVFAQDYFEKEKNIILKSDSWGGHPDCEGIEMKYR